MPTTSKWQSLPTEAINPVSLAIDKAPVRDIIEMVVNEDRKVVAAVQKEKERIAHGIEIVDAGAQKGGRVIFVGAGTSGRLGVVEASEMPPTFGTVADAGAGDHGRRPGGGVPRQGRRRGQLRGRARAASAGCGSRKKDVVIGVSASGMTPFVRGGLTRARKAGAKIIFVTCWPGSELQNFVDLQIAPAVGPEIIAGSTRLKAGTATKMVLNMLTTDRDDQGRQDLRQPDGRRADRVREAEGSRPPHPRHRDRPRLRRRRRAAQARASGTSRRRSSCRRPSLTLPQALRRLKKADDSVREAIGEDIEPRLRELLEAQDAVLTLRAATPPARLTPAPQRRLRLVEDQIDVVVQLQERRRQLGRERAVDHAARCTSPCSRRREQHDRARA